jgi:type 2A phosphatase activator TIP41
MPPAALHEGEAPHVLLPDNSGIDLHGWSVRASRGAIASTAREEAVGAELGIKLPGMLFDDSGLRLVHGASGVALDFRAVDALRGVGPADPSVRVAAAKVWDARVAPDDVEIAVLQGASDWTFSTRYAGSLAAGGGEGSAARLFRADGAAAVDYASLRRTDVPILFSAEVILFEDELDDNGTASYKVRVRVMPDSFFVLARFFLRVDGVLLRVHDARYFHRFGSDVLVRECSTRESDYQTLRETVTSDVLLDAEQVAAVMPVVSSETDNLKLNAV